MAEIEYLYFDLGNVILSFDHAIAATRIADVIDASPAEVTEWIFESGLQQAFESGEINREAFCNRFSELSNSNVGQEFLLETISDIFSLNRSLIPLISQLRAVNFPIGILSNTCIAHWEFALARFPVLDQLFSNFILSYEIGAMKPAALIYERALDVAAVEPTRCFFVDDRIENVEGARANGWEAVVYQSVDQLAMELRCRGVKFNF
ncbi:HAD family phosphatase [Mariniblastus sp.]|nr:HAD family phosphatase [Mariniblastus sp.]